MRNDGRTLRPHHLFGVAPALADGGDYPFLARVFEAHPTIREHGRHELADLLLQRLVGHGLIEQGRELSVRTLEAFQEFVPDKLNGDLFRRNLGRGVMGQGFSWYNLCYIYAFELPSVPEHAKGTSDGLRGGNFQSSMTLRYALDGSKACAYRQLDRKSTRLNSSH